MPMAAAAQGRRLAPAATQARHPATQSAPDTTANRPATRQVASRAGDRSSQGRNRDGCAWCAGPRSPDADGCCRAAWLRRLDPAYRTYHGGCVCIDGFGRCTPAGRRCVTCAQARSSCAVCAVHTAWRDQTRPVPCPCPESVGRFRPPRKPRQGSVDRWMAGPGRVPHSVRIFQESGYAWRSTKPGCRWAPVGMQLAYD